MEWRLLGPLEVLADGVPINLGGRQRRTLLAVLLVNAGQTVSTDRLIEELWGDSPPESARKTIQANIAHLRKALNSEAEVLISADTGYRLDAASADIDSVRFENLTGQAGETLITEPASSARDLEAALDLFRGAPLAGLADDSFTLRVEASRLEDARLNAIEDRLQGMIALGDSAGAATEAERSLAEHPTRERLWALLMQALYTAGRQAEALGAYSRLRQTLADELGIEPSNELQELEQQILEQQDLTPPTLTTSPKPGGPTVTRNPYKGLRPFDEADAADFFGRDDLVRRLVERLAASPPVRLTVLAGPSGAGKSSVVRAGLIPQLRAGDESVVGMVPGSDPQAALTRATGDTDQPPTLIVVDQFEELFTLTAETEAERFIDLIADPFSPLRWVVTVRADFLDRLLAHPKLGGLLDEALILVPPMQEHEVEAAVVGPAQRVGVEAEPGLVRQIILDVQDRPSSLPLLQYALTDTFERRQTDQLRLDDYQRAGGISGAVARRADQLYESLGEAKQEAAQQLFLQLVTVTDEGDVARRRVDRETLLGMGDRDVISSLLERFGSQRLLTFDQDPESGASTVDVAHEALISEWPRYALWVAEAHEDIRMRRRLAAAADEWEGSERETSFLLVGSRLAETQAWRETFLAPLSAAHQEFIDTSQATFERDRRRRRTLRTAAVGVLGLAAAVAIVFAFRATDQERVATARGLATASASNVESDPELAILLAIEAINQSPGQVLPEAQEALHAALQEHRTLLQLPGSGVAAFSPDGTLFSGGSVGGEIPIWSTTTGDPVLTLAGADDDHVVSMAWSPDGMIIAANIWNFVENRNVTRIFDAETGDEIWETGHPGIPLSLAISPDSRHLAVSFESGSPSQSGVRVIDIGAQEEIAFYPARAPGGVDLGPSGLLALADASDPPRVQIWNVITNEHVGDIPGDATDIAFAPDGSFIVVTGGTTPQVYEGETLELRFGLFGHTHVTRGVDIDASGSQIVTSGADGLVLVFDAENGKPLMTLAGHNASVDDVAITADGTRVASGGNDESVRIWDISPEGTVESFRFDGVETSFDPAGSRLALAGATGASVVDTGSGLEIARLTNGGIATRHVRFSPDGATLGTTVGSEAQLWDTATWVEVGGWEIGFDPNGIEYRNDGEAVVVWHRTAEVDERAQGTSGVATAHIDTNTLEPGPNVLAASGTTDLKWNPVAASFAVSLDEGRLQLQSPSDWIWIEENAHGFTGTSREITEIDFSHDGSMLASIGDDGSIKIWDATTGEELQALGTGAGAELFSVDFGPEGRLLATGAGNGEVVIWDLEQDERLLTVSQLPGIAWSVEFSPDGSTLAVGMAEPNSSPLDGKVSLFLLDVDDLVDLALRRLTRWWTPEEARIYLQTEECPEPPPELTGCG